MSEANKVGKTSLIKIFKDIGRKPITDAMSRILVESLWRNPLLLYKEKATLEPLLDEFGEPIDPYQKSTISPLIQWGQALGQDNLIEGNRSIAIGQSNHTTSFLEIVCGVYATAPAANATEWVPSDRLFTVGNGTGDTLRNDALTVYKSGYTVTTNALLVGDYDHRDEVGILIDPLNGTLRFTEADKYQFWDVDHWASLGGAGSYTLPIATASVLGGIKVGSNLSIDPVTGILSATGITGSGTAGYLAKFTGTTAIGDSPVYTDGTKVGIGTTTLTRRLTVGTADTNDGLLVAPASGFSAGKDVALYLGDVTHYLKISYNAPYRAIWYDYNGIDFTTNSGNVLSVQNGGKVGLGTSSPTAILHIKAGTATASTAPLKFTAGTNLATTEAGAIEFDGTHLYFTATNGGTRYQLDQQAVTYTLPIATDTILGGIKVGSNLSIDPVTGVLSASGGTGTVTDFSASGISGVFTTSVATSTTTPALSFALVSKNANRVFASPDGTSGVPSFRQIVVGDISATGIPSATTFLCGNGSWATPPGGSGTVTSVAMTTPTGLTVSGSPITTSGTLALALQSGYSIPTTTKQGQWDTAYGWGNHASVGYLKNIQVNGAGDYATSGTIDFVAGSGIIITNSIGHITIAATGGGTGTVTSVAMTTPTGLTVSGSPITTSGTLALSLQSGYSIPTTVKQGQWDEAYTNMGKVAFHDNFTLIGYLNSSNFSIAGGVISLKLKTINSTSLIGIGDLSLQPTLVSGTNIKTINGTSLLGSGDITISGATNYWQQGSSPGYVAPATITDQVRIGSTTSIGGEIFQVTGSGRFVGDLLLAPTSSSGYAFQISSNKTGAAALIYNSTGYGLNVSSVGYAAIQAQAQYSNTNSSQIALEVSRFTSGTPAIGIGSHISFTTNNSTGSTSNVEYGTFGIVSTAITSANESGSFFWKLKSGGSLAQKMILDKDGILSTVGGLLSSGGAIGYTTGAGSTASQGTSKATAVTCNALCGDITTFSAALAAASEATFTVNNNKVLAGDIILVNHVSGGTNGAYLVSVTAVAAGSFSITYSNVSTASKTEAPVFRFAIFRAVTA